MKLAAFLLALGISGCSFIFVRGPPSERPQSGAVDCTSSVVAPVLDLIWAGLNGTGAVQAISTDQATWNRQTTTSRDAVIGIGLTWLVVSGASAIYGFKTTDACRQAVAASRPGRLPPPPPPPPGPSPERCSRDIDCKGDRICMQHECVSPERH
jgi:hypothetical protein